EINTLVEQAAKHAPVPRVGSVIPDIGNALNDNVWETYRASQTLAHFGDKDLGLLGIYYTQLTNIRRFEGEENRDWGVIKVLEGACGNAPRPRHHCRGRGRRDPRGARHHRRRI